MTTSALSTPTAARVPRRWVRAVLTRLGTSLLVLWGAVTVSFAALHLTPGSVEDALIGTDTVSPQVREQIVTEYGLDRPVAVQYLTYLGRLLRGDLGHSYQLHEPVATLIAGQLRASLALTVAAMGLALLVSVTLALLTAHRRPWIRGLSSGLELAGVSVPTFWWGILLLTVFSFHLGWFPAAGADDSTALLLPAVAVATPLAALLTQVLREVLTAVQSKDLPVVTGVVLLSAVCYVVINILLDLLYLVIDPRLRGAP